MPVIVLVIGVSVGGVEVLCRENDDALLLDCDVVVAVEVIEMGEVEVELILLGRVDIYVGGVVEVGAVVDSLVVGILVEIYLIF